MEIIIGIIAGLAIGALGTLFVLNKKSGNEKSSFEQEKEQLNAQLKTAEINASQLAQKVEVLTEQLTESKAEARQRIQEEKDEHRLQQEQMREELQRQFDKNLLSQQQQFDRSREEQQKRFNDALETMRLQINDTTGKMLKDRQKEFAEANHNEFLKPLQQALDEMRKTLTQHTQSNSEVNGKLSKAMDDFMRETVATRHTAEELTNAFKHRSKVQGNWGEAVLSELLTTQGLKEGVHFSTQETMTDASGASLKDEDDRRRQPDVILHLDTRREVIIDAKVSLTAFMDYVNAENEADREAALKAHIKSIENHVKELSQKDYSSFVVPPKVKIDYVIMFVPHSAALWTALNAEPELWRKAMEKNVYIADEQTLYAALRIINLTWTQIVQAQNHQKVYELASEMIDRVGQFTKHYQAIGKHIQAVVKSYNDGNKKLEEKGQSIIGTGRKLELLGAKQNGKNALPAELIDIDQLLLPEQAQDITPDDDN